MPIECKHGEMQYKAQCRQWMCRSGCAPISEQLAALNRLGPWTPPPRESLISDVPGYVKIGPNSYERIGHAPDFRDVWQAQFHQPTARDERGAAAITDAVAMAIGEGAVDTARELLIATLRR